MLMSRTSTLILLGFLIMLVPFSGLPMSIRSLLAAIFGASVLGIGLAIRAHEARSMKSSAEAPASEPEPAPPQGVSPI